MLYFYLSMYVFLGLFSFIPFYFVVAYFFIRPIIQPLSSQHYLLLDAIPIATSMMFFIGNSILIHKLKSNTKIFLPRILYPLIIFALGFISLISTNDLNQSIAHLAKYIIVIGVYVVISYNATSYTKLKKMLSLITLSSLIPLLYGFYQRFIMFMPRPDSFMSDYNEFGIYICLMIMINLFVIINSDKHYKFKYIFYIILLLQIISLVISLNRGSWIALTLSLFLSIIFFYKNLPVAKILISFLFICLISFGVIYQRMSELNKLNEDGYSQNTFAGRIGAWKTLSNMINIKPITGYGIGTASSIDLHGVNIAPHNDYIRMAYDLGWLGGVVYFLFLLSPCYSSLFNRTEKYSWSLKFISFASGVYFFVISCFQNPAYSFINMPLYLLLTSLPHYKIQIYKDEKGSGLSL